MTSSSAVSRTAALLTAGAAVIHLGVASAHFAEWWAAGLFFLAAGASQAAWAVAVWSRRASRRVLVAGLAGNAALVALWAVSRSTGLPVGPGAGTPEPVGPTDAITVVMEACAVLVVALELWSPVAIPRAASAGRWARGLAGGVALAVLAATGVALAAPGEAHPQAQSTGDARGVSHGSATGAPSDGAAQAPRHGHPNLPDTSSATPEQTAAARQLLANTITATTAYRDITAAKAAGFDVQAAWERRTAVLKRLGRTPGTDRVALVHVPNRENRRDGRVLDATKPETLMYAHTSEGAFVLVGVMFTAERKPPPSSYQPYLRWHTHTFCRGGGLARLKPVDGSCPAGTEPAETGAMTHLWFVEESDLVYAYAMRPPRQQMLEYQQRVRAPVGHG